MHQFLVYHRLSIGEVYKRISLPFSRSNHIQYLSLFSSYQDVSRSWKNLLVQISIIIETSMSDVFNEALIRSHSPRTKLFLNTTQHGSVRNRSSTLSMFSPRPRAQQIERDAMIGARDSKTRFRPMTGRRTQLVAAFLFLHPLSFYSYSLLTFGYGCF